MISSSLPVQALVASLAAGLCSGLGGVPFLFVGTVSHKVFDVLAGFAAGVMIAASLVGLVLPAFESGSVGQGVVGLMAGAAVLWGLSRLIPHTHPGYSGGGEYGFDLGRALLIAAAVTLHNLPEGFAIGAGFFSGDVSRGLILAVALGAHNVPEGLLVALPLRAAGVSRSRALWAATASGLAEPLGALLSVALFSVISAFTPFFLSFAAGAMIFVTSHELIPESHAHGHQDEASMAVVVGFIFMLLLHHFLE